MSENENKVLQESAAQTAVSEAAGETEALSAEEITQKNKKLTFQFASMSWSYWFAQCFGIYLSSFLISKGWVASQIGILNSINNAVGAFSSPFWGTISDKIKSVKKILIFLIIAGSTIYALVPFVDIKFLGISVLFILLPINTFFKTPVNSLIDNWTVRSCNKHGLNFGFIRSFGSIAFGVIGLIMGYVIPKINAASADGLLGTTLTFPLYAVFSVVLLLVIFSVKEENAQGTGRQRFRDMHFEKLFSNYYYMTYLVYAMVIQIPMACVNSFFSYLLKDIGVDLAMIGYVQGLKAFIEIPMLLLMDRVRNKVPLYYLLIASGILYMFEAFFYSISASFLHIMLICMLQGLAGGLHIAAGSNYVATLSPANLKATAQTFNGSMVSIAGILGNAIGGCVVDAVGIRPFYKIAAAILCVAITLYALTFPFGEKVLKIPRPKIILHGVQNMKK